MAHPGPLKRNGDPPKIVSVIVFVRFRAANSCASAPHPGSALRRLVAASGGLSQAHRTQASCFLTERFVPRQLHALRSFPDYPPSRKPACIGGDRGPFCKRNSSRHDSGAIFCTPRTGPFVPSEIDTFCVASLVQAFAPSRGILRVYPEFSIRILHPVSS